MTNCFNSGDVSCTLESTLSSPYVGGFVATSTGKFTNCYFSGTITVNAKGTINVGIFSPRAGTCTNCYYKTDSFTGNLAANADKGITGKDSDAFASGEVCYLLNGKTSEGDLVWYQTINKQDTPQFNGEIVYHDANKTPQYFNKECEHTSGTIIYTNNGDNHTYTYTCCNLTDTEAHSNNENGYCEKCQVKITGASIIVGQDLTMNYRVEIKDTELLANIEKIAMQFTKNEKTVTVYAGEPTEEGYYVFAYANITPQCMSDFIDAKLVLINGETVTLIASKEGYSVKQNAQNLLKCYSSNTELIQLLTDMLTYGEAAQNYRDYNLDNLATQDVAGLGTPSELLPEKTDMTLTTTNTSETGLRFVSAGVWFDNVNKLYVKVSAIDNVKILAKVNNETVKTYENVEDFEESNGAYIICTDAITATGFDTVYTFELYEGGTLVQTLTYSVSSYVYAMMGKTEDDGVTLTEMAELARTLYRYGVSAVAYQESKT